MSQEQEKYFERLVPLNSVLGREFVLIQAERNKQKRLFESDKNKMACDTLLYRRAEIALGRFIDDWTAKVVIAKAKLEDSKERLENAEAKAQDNSRGHGIVLNRSDTKKIWKQFALERYRQFAKPLKKIFKKYHPSMWRDLNSKWGIFRKDIERWRYGSQAYDGSQAMSAMIDFQMQCRLLASHND